MHRQCQGNLCSAVRWRERTQPDRQETNSFGFLFNSEEEEKLNKQTNKKPLNAFAHTSSDTGLHQYCCNFCNAIYWFWSFQWKIVDQTSIYTVVNIKWCMPQLICCWEEYEQWKERCSACLLHKTLCFLTHKTASKNICWERNGTEDIKLNPVLFLVIQFAVVGRKPNTKHQEMHGEGTSEESLVHHFLCSHLQQNLSWQIRVGYFSWWLMVEVLPPS